jgi:hypothetical protein
MPFEPGHPRYGGMKEGQRTKRNQEVNDLADEFGITALRVKYMLMLGKFKELGYSEEQIAQLTPQEIIDIQSKNAADVLPYAYGKRKPIDSEGNDGLDPITELVSAFRNKR